MISSHKKPNIFMIMVDQLRTDWLGCAGTKFVDTPNLDSIASEGTWFERATCSSPLCSPSRASITSGLYPHRIGVIDNFVNYPLDQRTVFQDLREAGYRVGVVGKTDLHKFDLQYTPEGDSPIMYHWGFTDVCETIGKMAVVTYDPQVMCPYKRYLIEKGELDILKDDYVERVPFKDRKPGQNGRPIWYAKENPLPLEDNHEMFIARRTEAFLEDMVKRGEPWFMLSSFVGPHNPWDAPQEYYQKYRGKEYEESISDSMEGKPEWVKRRSALHSEGMTQKALNEAKRQYAGMINMIDDCIGSFIKKLKDLGQFENTVIIFCSDHGEMMGDHGLFEKDVMYEASIRVPLIISDPRKKQIKRSGAMAELVDLYPTILELAEIPYDTRRLDGTSLCPLLYGEKEKHKLYQFSELNNTRMIFDGRYKLIQSHNDRSELYDLEKDPQELCNIIEYEPEKTRALQRAMVALRM